ncbi:hypothetical protein BS47DRAFT_1395387 [Hydnum rufescens UP504]|uniref:Uncharacterized protein n=1 Tax=Hydnum rufescens UP504 TaxID=1448309 RepID=A0A9P6ATF4_9AGAM|nr:hypothetical protein BS47DRAFT_1395387 [Hydnum rufescens UP504]
MKHRRSDDSSSTRCLILRGSIILYIAPHRSAGIESTGEEDLMAVQRQPNPHETADSSTPRTPFHNYDGLGEKSARIEYRISLSPTEKTPPGHASNHQPQTSTDQRISFGQYHFQFYYSGTRISGPLLPTDILDQADLRALRMTPLTPSPKASCDGDLSHGACRFLNKRLGSNNFKLAQAYILETLRRVSSWEFQRTDLAHPGSSGNSGDVPPQVLGRRTPCRVIASSLQPPPVPRESLYLISPVTRTILLDKLLFRSDFQDEVDGGLA